MAAKQELVVCKRTEIAPGERKLVTVDGKQIGVFNVDGQFFALLNYCPHYGGALCRGPITGTTLPTNEFKFVYGHEGSVLRCAWHGWEFDIPSGELLINRKIKAKRYAVTVNAAGDVVVHI